MFSGVNYFYDQIIALLIFLIFLIVLYVIKPSKIDNNFIYLLCAYFIVFFLQSFAFKQTSVYYFFRYSVFILLIPYLILKLVPLNYNNYLIKIVYILTIIDLGIWIISLVNPAFNQLLYQLSYNLKLDPSSKYPQSLILYTHERDIAMGIQRFAGFWHEPGAYAVLLGYCICFNTLIKNKLNSKENLVFLIGFLATLSTTAYLAISICLYAYFLLFIKRKSLLKLLILPVLILSFIYFYKKLDFMEDKIEEQIEIQMAPDISGTKTSGRFLGFRKSFNVIKTYPLFGRGLSTKTQAEITSAEDTGYGWPGYYARIGIPLSIVLSILFYKAIKLYTIYYKADKKWIPIFIMLFIILLFSQKHTSSIIFMMIFLTPIAYAKRFKKHFHLRNMTHHQLLKK